jgi:NADPH-dependent glutamate synthase beta subunit-like oxidoreductase/NAD-dependent dihydropyrimidine dehydrogenase PreA subunit
MTPHTKSCGRYRVKVLGLEDYQALVACRDACPLQTDTKGYTRAVAEGDYERAYRIARQTNPLVSVCSRVCQAPCEDACRRAGAEDGPVAMRALKRFACDRHGIGSGMAVRDAFGRLEEEGDPASDISSGDVLGLLRLARAREAGDRRTGKDEERVAVVGSGPAGLAAAHDLALLGYRVTVYEAAPMPGGMLRWGIPAFRLPRDVLQAEIDAILALGVEMKLNCPIGRDPTIDDLKQEGFGAVFVAVGLQASRSLPLEGSELAGIWGGIDYLRDYGKIPVGARCLVIGGGGVAIDCAQLALRQGAASVTVACLESWEEMPATAAEKQDAGEEGIRFFPSLGPKRFLGEEGRVRAVEFLKVESVFDGQGNFAPTLRPGTEQILEADTVLVSVGQCPEESILRDAARMETTPAGTVRVDEDLATNLPGVFAGGDILAGPQSVVHAMAAGKKAALSIDAHLSGRNRRVRKRARMQVLDPGFVHPEAEKIAAAGSPKRPVEQRIADHREIDLPYEEDQARRQAARCRQCHVQTVFDRSLCILCGTCVDTCVENAYKMVRMEDVEGDEDVARLTDALSRRGAQGRGWTAIIKDETRCVRCGVCARRCPTGAITMEAFHLEEEWEYE